MIVIIVLLTDSLELWFIIPVGSVTLRSEFLIFLYVSNITLVKSQLGIKYIIIAY